jgi:hypothetical protein
MARKNGERVRVCINDAVYHLYRHDKYLANECLKLAYTLIDLDTKDRGELEDLASVLKLKAYCDATSEEAATYLKESIRIEESLLSGYVDDFKLYFSYVDLSQKYLQLGDQSKAMEYSDKVDIDSVGDKKGMPDVLINLYGTYAAVRGKTDKKGKACLLKGRLIAERIDDAQNYVKASVELANIALNFEKDEDSAFTYCEQGWAWAARNGLERAGDYGPLLNICKIAWSCFPKEKDILWYRRVKAVTAKVLERGHMETDAVKLYLISAYTLNFIDPSERLDEYLTARCRDFLGNDDEGLAACFVDAARRAQAYS